MAFNPLQLLKIKEKLNAFRDRHPGFSRFIRALRREGVPEGSIVYVKVTTPDGKKSETNFRIVPEDIELISMIIDLGKKELK